MICRRATINGSILALAALTARPSFGTVLTFNNSRSDGKTYVGSYSDPTDPLNTYGSNVNFGSNTTGTTMVVQNASNTDTFNYQIGNGWTPNVTVGYSVGASPAVGINYTGPSSQWPNGAAQLDSSTSNPNDSFYFSFTPAAGYAVRVNQLQFVNASSGTYVFGLTVYENTIGGTQMVPTYVPPSLGSGAGVTATENLQAQGSMFFQGTVILGVYVASGNYDSLGVANLSFDQEAVAGFGNWGISGSGDWNVASNWGGDAIPNGVGATATLGTMISSAQTVYSNKAITLGSLTFNNSNTYVITGAGSLTMQASSGNAAVNVDQGSQEISIPLIVASNTTLNVANASTLTIGNPLTIYSGSTLSQSGAGTVIYNSVISVANNANIAFGNSTRVHGLTIGAGGSGSINSPNGGVVLEVDSLSNSGTLNVANNELLINYGSGVDPVASIRSELMSGYNGGAWNGTGIDSSSAAAHPGYALGYADAADPGNPAGLASGMIEIKYTLLGDADLNGIVNGLDFGILAANFNKGVTGWDQGDFDYNGIVNGIDFGDLAGNFNQGANYAQDIAALDAFAAANGLAMPTLRSVPEPASLALFALGMIGTIRHRRSNSSHE